MRIINIRDFDCTLYYNIIIETRTRTLFGIVRYKKWRKRRGRRREKRSNGVNWRILIVVDKQQVHGEESVWETLRLGVQKFDDNNSADRREQERPRGQNKLMGVFFIFAFRGNRSQVS